MRYMFPDWWAMGEGMKMPSAGAHLHRRSINSEAQDLPGEYDKATACLAKDRAGAHLLRLSG